MIPRLSFFALILLIATSADIGSALAHRPISTLSVAIPFVFGAFVTAIYAWAKQREATDASVGLFPFALSPVSVIALLVIAAIVGFALPPSLLSFVGFGAMAVLVTVLRRKGATP